jgi:hypothetical protein
MTLLIKNIASLVQTETAPRQWVAGKDMSELAVIENAFLKIDGGTISDFGPMAELRIDSSSDKIIDASGIFLRFTYSSCLCW